MRRITVVEHTDLRADTANGIDSVIRGLIRKGRDINWTVVCVTNDPRRALGVWGSETVGGSEVEVLPVAYRQQGIRKGIPNSMSFALGLLRFHRRLPRSTEIHTHRIEIGVLLRILVRRSPIVQFIHNDTDALLSPWSDSKWRHYGLAYRGLQAFMLAAASCVVIFSRSLGSRLALESSKVLTRTTWFDEATFNARSRVVKQVANSKTIVWCGRLDDQKDPLFAVQVLSALAVRQPGWTLQIIGDGVLRTAVVEAVREAHLTDSVQLIAPVPQEVLARYMTSARAVLMTSRYEGSPTVLVEALACGVPVVATEASDPDGLLTDSRNGRRCMRDPHQLAAAFLDLPTCTDLEDGAVQSRSSSTAVPILLRDIHNLVLSSAR